MYPIGSAMPFLNFYMLTGMGRTNETNHVKINYSSGILIEIKGIIHIKH